MRIARLVVVMLAFSVVTVAAAPASAQVSPAYSFVVPCDDSNGVETDPIVLPAGLYTATVVGACSTNVGELHMFTAETPCGTATTGPLPCVTASISNIPSAACWWTVGAAFAHLCGPGGQTFAHLNGCFLTVMVANTCLTAGTTGQVTHAATGYMHATFVDSDYSDNFGTFVVVVRQVV